MSRGLLTERPVGNARWGTPDGNAQGFQFKDALSGGVGADRTKIVRHQYPNIKIERTGKEEED